MSGHQDIFCSTVIPTIGRPTLTAAVESVLSQDMENTEIIVVNDSGARLSFAEWQRSDRVTIVSTPKRGRSVARNTGAALARGRYLHFLDDDDAMLPGALAAFNDFAQTTRATWLYGMYEVTDRDGNLLEKHAPEVQGDFFAAALTGETIPFGAALVDLTAFFAAGGYDPNMAVREDADLARRIARMGSIARLPFAVASFRVGHQGSSSPWSLARQQEGQSTERTLRQTDVFAALYRSTTNDSYWRGRLSRVYASSMMRNFRHKDLLVATSRFLCILALAGFHLRRRNFWRGLRRQPPLG